MNCFKKIQEDILSGVFAPGERLILSKLKKTFNLGQSPIREALSRLIETGLVQFDHNKGFRVTQLSESDIRQLIIATCLIEELCIRKSIEFGQDPWEVGIVAAMHQVSILVGRSPIEYKFWHECNAAFFRSLSCGYTNEYLLQIRTLLFLKLERYRRIIIDGHYKSPKEYQIELGKIADATLRRDTPLAITLLLSHYTDPLEWIIDALNLRKASAKS